MAVLISPLVPVLCHNPNLIYVTGWKSVLNKKYMLLGAAQTMRGT